MAESSEVLQSNSYGKVHNYREITGDVDTTDSFVPVGTVDCRMFKSQMFHICETGGINAIKYDVYGAIYTSNWKKLTASPVTVAAGESDYEPVRWDAWNFLKVEVASNAAGSAGHAKVYFSGKA